MRKDTRERYIKRFDGHMKGRKITPREIILRLEELAHEQTGPSWRETRIAFATAIEAKAKRWSRGDKNRLNRTLELAKEVREMKNPVLVNDRKKVDKRVKKITRSDVDKMLSEAAKMGGEDGDMARAIITVMMSTGARINEVPFMIRTGKRSVSIPGSKKRDDRGLDRDVEFDTTAEAIRVIDAVNTIRKHAGHLKDPARRLRKAFKMCAIAAFPRRKSLPVPYTLRHQFGANLKGAGVDRSQIAYIMGHRCTRSADVYGNGKSGHKSAISIRPSISPEMVQELVKVNHGLPPVKRPAEAVLERSRTVGIDYKQP